jgi:hypothetical protein
MNEKTVAGAFQGKGELPEKRLFATFAREKVPHVRLFH